MIPVVVVAGVSVGLAVVTGALVVHGHESAAPVDTARTEHRLEDAVRRSPRLRRAARRMLRGPLERWSVGALALVAALVVVASVALVLGLLLDMVDDDEGLARLDSSVARWGAEHTSAGWARVVEAVTQLGARPVVLVLLALTALSDWARRRNGEVVAVVAAVAIGEMLLVNVVKVVVERERPDVLPLVDAGGWSFPSGHTSAAAAAWSVAALVLGRDRSRRTRAVLASAAVLVAVAVASSRALLGVHWLTDVLAGLVLGWGWYVVVAVTAGGRRQRIAAPLETAAGVTTDLAGSNDAFVAPTRTPTCSAPTPPPGGLP